jgi:hypothetical protein
MIRSEVIAVALFAMTRLTRLTRRRDDVALTAPLRLPNFSDVAVCLSDFILLISADELLRRRRSPVSSLLLLPSIHSFD